MRDICTRLNFSREYFSTTTNVQVTKKILILFHLTCEGDVLLAHWDEKIEFRKGRHMWKVQM